MGLTVRELTEMMTLRTRFLAGRNGGDRAVHWAHAIELPDPWNWLGTGDLLLSNGLGFPHEATGQVHAIEELNRSNLAGVVFGEGPHAPALTSEALRAADALDFPVLASEYSVPWAVLARTVADSNTQKRHRQIARVVRAYDLLRRSYGSPGLKGNLLTALGAECECALHVLDQDSGTPLLPTTQRPPEAVRDAVLERLGRADPLPAFSRVTADDSVTIVLPIAESSRAVLLATPVRRETSVDLMVLQHISTIVGLEVERRAAQALRRRESGARLLRQLLSGTVDPEEAPARLAAHGLESAPWRILNWGEDSRLGIGEAGKLLAAKEIPHLLRDEGDEVVALVGSGALDGLRDAITAHARARIGASQPVGKLSGLADSAREARWAREAARSSRERIIVYGEGTSPFLPRSVKEGEAVVERILGPVLDYDTANDSHLLCSLVAYFDANRSWQEGADALGIHRQTLIYRIGRVEKLTGHCIRDLTDQTELFLAVQTWKMLKNQSAGQPDTAAR